MRQEGCTSGRQWEDSSLYWAGAGSEPAEEAWAGREAAPLCAHGGSDMMDMMTFPASPG